MGSIFKALVSVPEPNQARSREALNRFLSAGETLLADNRYEEAGIADLAREAQSSVGTFYRLLSDKETLSLLLLQRFFTEIEFLVEDTFAPQHWQGKDITDIADTFSKVFVDTYHGRAGALRATILRASKDASFREQVHAMNNLISNRMGKLLKQRRDEINHPKPEQAIKSVAHMVLGILNQHTITGTLGGLSQKALAEELKRVFLTYLGVSR
jgi:AcrR family transcriptional regulator